ncbi:MAG: NTP transferase domain-containing protein [Longimicrobiales bacterium]
MRTSSAPDSEAPRPPRVDAIVLAAGLSSRTGHANKLLAQVDGVPMVARVVRAALASRAEGVVVVTGYEAARVETALVDEAVRFVRNDLYESGLASSLCAGIRALGPGVDGALVCLGDMPWVGADVMDALIADFDPGRGQAICVPTCDSRRGNPVLWGADFFAAIDELVGDDGARRLLGEYAERVVEVPVGDRGIFLDLDTAADLDSHTDGERRVLTQD